MKRKLTAILMALIMVFTLSPSVFAAESTQEPSQTEGVELTKTAAIHKENGAPDGTVDISIEAYTTGTVTSVESANPTDIVLLLDVSGSMGDSISDGNSYEKADGRKWNTGFWLWQTTHYGMQNTRTKYFVEMDEEYLPVKYDGEDENGFTRYYYMSGESRHYVYPSGNYGSANPQYTGDPKLQFYRSVSSTVTKMALLQDAVDGFIQQTKNLNTAVENDADKHRIAIVKYADDSYYRNIKDIKKPSLTEGNNQNGFGYNYTELVRNFTTVTDDGATSLTNEMDELIAGGATAIDYGLTLTEALIANRGDDSRDVVVIAFTDGEPNHDRNFDPSVAATAINKAKDLKDVGVRIFSVGLFEGADGTQLGTGNRDNDLANRFMHYISSNYPDATASGNNWEEPNAAEGDGPQNGYYMARSADLTLADIFESIATQIGAPTIELGEDATLVDVISNKFDLTDSDINNITLQTADMKSDGNFSDPVDVPESSGITASVGEGDKAKNVTISGFDFDKYYVSNTPRPLEEEEIDAFYGRKLIITINVTPDYSVIDKISSTEWNEEKSFETNDSLTLLDSEGDEVATAPSPKIKFNTVTYNIEGASDNPHAQYLRLPGSVNNVIDKPSRDGFIFDGWNLSSPEGLAVGDGAFTMPVDDVEFVGS